MSIESFSQLILSASKQTLKKFFSVSKEVRNLCIKELAFRRWESLYFNLKGELEENEWHSLLTNHKKSVLGAVKAIKTQHLGLLTLFWDQGFYPKSDFWIKKAIDNDALISLQFFAQKGFKIQDWFLRDACVAGSLDCLQWLIAQGFKPIGDFANSTFKARLGLAANVKNNEKSIREAVILNKKYIKILDLLTKDHGLNVYPSNKKMFSWSQSKDKIIVNLNDFFNSMDQKDYFEDDIFLVRKHWQNENWAIKAGFNDIAKLIMTRRLEEGFGGKIDLLNLTVRAGNLDMLKFMKEEFGYRLEYLSKIDDVDILMWCMPDWKEKDLSRNLKEAATNGSVRFLEWAFQNNKMGEFSPTFRSIDYYPLTTLKWFHKRKIAGLPGTATFQPAKTLRWLFKRGIKMNQVDLNNLMSSQNFDRLLLAAEFGMLPDAGGVNFFKIFACELYRSQAEWLALKGIPDYLNVCE